MDIPVVILCGGLGTRLREETEYRPKPMVKIGGKPILWHIMKIYAHHGYRNFILSLGYKGEMIKEYFYNYEILNNDFTIELGKQNQFEIHNNHQENGWRITLADTGDYALKGARIKRIQKYVEHDQFMMTYGDGLTDINLHALLRFHNQHGKIGTVTGINPASRFGELKVNQQHVESFNEKPDKGSSIVNGGFFVFNYQIFDYLHDDDSCDLEIGPLEKITEEGQLMAYEHNGFWTCMDNIRDMEYLNKLWEEDQAAWKIW